jgi:cell division protein FtsB
LARWWPIPLLLCAAALVAALDGRAGLRAWWELRDGLRDAEAQRAALRLEVESLRSSALALESDSFAIERAIRERLRLAKPRETLVRLSGPDPASPRFP